MAQPLALIDEHEAASTDDDDTPSIAQLDALLNGSKKAPPKIARKSAPTHFERDPRKRKACDFLIPPTKFPFINMEFTPDIDDHIPEDAFPPVLDRIQAILEASSRSHHLDDALHSTTTYHKAQLWPSEEFLEKLANIEDACAKIRKELANTTYCYTEAQ